MPLKIPFVKISIEGSCRGCSWSTSAELSEPVAKRGDLLSGDGNV